MPGRAIDSLRSPEREEEDARLPVEKTVDRRKSVPGAGRVAERSDSGGEGKLLGREDLDAGNGRSGSPDEHDRADTPQTSNDELTSSRGDTASLGRSRSSRNGKRSIGANPNAA